MRTPKRHVSLIPAVAMAGCLALATTARADVLVTNEFQATSSDAIETTPTLGSDNGVSVLVYTSIDLATFNSRVRYQRLTDTGTLGPAVDVGSGNTNDNLNDVSGNWIVYTATQPSNPGIKQIRKYRISDGFDTGVSGFGAMGEARIHGGNIAWVEGTRIYLSVANASEIRIAGPVPAASELEIGDTFVVFQQDGDIWAYDLRNPGSSKAANGGNNPTTSGSWVVWEAAGIIQGVNLDTGATVALGDAGFVNANPSIDGNNIAWESNAAGNFDIYLHRIAEGDTFQVTTSPADQQLDSVFGNQVAYLDNRAGLDIWASTFSFAQAPIADAVFSFGGTATIIDPQNLIGGSAFGVPFQGSFSFDPDAQLINTSPAGPGITVASYRMTPPLPPNELSVALRGIVIEADPGEPLEILMQDGTPGNSNPTDSFELISNHPRTPGVVLEPHPQSSFDLVFLDSTGAVFSNASIPTAFELTDFNLTEFRIQFRDENNVNNILYEVFGPLNSLAPDQEPPDNSPPTANAGPDQTIHAGDTVFLDGSASFDDNTATASLLYSWSFFSLPAGSTATLLDAETATPSFVADVAGTFLVQLLVTDEGGLSGVPDEVLISSDNLAPAADAGSDQLVITGSIVDLDGSGSSDPETDPLTFAWALTSAPLGSTATLSGASTASPSFVPDVDGLYEVTLVVSDFIGPGTPDTVLITATTAEDFAEIQIVLADDIVEDLVASQIRTQGNQKAFRNFLRQAILAIQAGDLAEAIDKLEKAIQRTDGCVLRGMPDGNGPGRDWITDCTAQIEVYNRLNAALDALTP